MRKISRDIALAFLNHEFKSKGNSMTDGENIWLHGHRIARHWTGDTIEVSLADWNTRTTRERLNALAELAGSKLRFCQVDFEPCARNIADGTVWRIEPDQWMTL